LVCESPSEPSTQGTRCPNSRPPSSESSWQSTVRLLGKDDLDDVDGHLREIESMARSLSRQSRPGWRAQFAPPALPSRAGLRQDAPLRNDFESDDRARGPIPAVDSRG